MEINQIEEGEMGMFQASENGAVAGAMFYTWPDKNTLTIQHTEVSEAFAGKGVGKKILMEIVKFAREKQIKIIALCPFAKSVFDKMPEIRDVLA
jgi:predicted GNAT family acetyltransferase